MANSEPQGGGPATDFEALAKQYWNAWGDAMRGAAPPAAGPHPAQTLQDAVDWWTRLAQQGRGGTADDTVSRFDAQARQWYAQMQQVAAQFTGRDGSAADVVEAWKRALGAAGANPFPEMLRSMHGPGLHDFDQWMQHAAPLLQAWRAQAGDWLGTPTFGFAREHQERWQGLARAQVELQQRNEAYSALMLQASQQAYHILERRLAEREQPGLQIDSPRALFDLWIEAAEEAYAEVALSPEFRKAYGQLVNAQMRVRAAVQREVEQVCASLGMPTRSELDGAHRKLAELERQVRRLRDAVSSPAAAPAGAADKPRKAATAGEPGAGSETGGKRASAPRAARSAAAKTGAKTAAAKPAAPENAAATAGDRQRATKAKAARKSAPSPAKRAAGRAKRSAASVPAAPAPMKTPARRKR